MVLPVQTGRIFFWHISCFMGANSTLCMKKLLITFLLLAGFQSFTTAQETAPGHPDKNFKFQFPGTNLHGLTQLSQPDRDSMLLAFAKFDPAQISFSGTGISESLQKQFRSVLLDMMEVVKNVIKDPATISDMEKKMHALSRKMEGLQDDMDYEMDLVELKNEYEEDVKQRTKEYQDGKYETKKEKKVAKRELDQELRDRKHEFEEDRIRLRKER